MVSMYLYPGTTTVPHCITPSPYLDDYAKVGHVKKLIEEYKVLLSRSTCTNCKCAMSQVDLMKLEYLKELLKDFI